MPAMHDFILHKQPQQLDGLDKWIAKAIEHAEAKGFDPDTFVEMRLAPDMFNFGRQVESACDAAKFAAARTSGKEAPKHEDKQTTLAQLRARIKSTLDYLATFKPEDLGSEDAPVSLPFMEGKVMKAGDYVVDLASPNFAFHLTMAYAILRGCGVTLGKRDYLIEMRTSDA